MSQTGETKGWQLQLRAAAIQGQHNSRGLDYSPTTAPQTSGGVYVVIHSTTDFLAVKIKANPKHLQELSLPQKPWPTNADLLLTELELGGKVQLQHGQLCS